LVLPLGKTWKILQCVFCQFVWRCEIIEDFTQYSRKCSEVLASFYVWALQQMEKRI
jgi:hypothetical protein